MPEKITDLDVRKVDIQMPFELKEAIEGLHNIVISEDTVQLSIYNPHTRSVIIWIYNSSKQIWTKLSFI